MRLLTIVAAILLTGLAHASDAGNPLDCSDWVILQPGISCEVHTSTGALGASSPFLRFPSPTALDNKANVYVVRHVPLQIDCQGVDEEEIQIVRWDGEAEFVVARIGARHGKNGSSECDNLRARPAAVGQVGDLLWFDPANGQLLVPVESFCSADTPGGDVCPVDYGGGWWIVSFKGFATVAEIDESSSGPVPPRSGALRSLQR